MTNRSKTDSNSRYNSRHYEQGKSQGFTLIEMMIVVVVSAVILVLAVPNYNLLIQKRELTSAAEAIHSLVVFARQEAIKRNEEVTVAWYSPGGHMPGWCVGLSVGATPCDCTEDVVTECVIDDVPYRLNQADFARAQEQFFHAEPSEAAKSFFTFDPIRGILNPDTLPSEVETRIDNGEHIFSVHSDSRGVDDSGSDRWYALEMTVDHTGLFSICSDTTRKSVVGGYPQC